MMLSDEIIEKLKAVEAFQNRVEGVLNYQALTKTGAKPAQMPCAFVLPTGISGAVPTIATGLYRQQLENTFSVIFVVDAPDDLLGQQSLTPIDTITTDIIDVLVGWQPASAQDMMIFKRCRLVDIRQGTAYYQIDFSTSTYVRQEKS
jgi:hypothetical protein